MSSLVRADATWPEFSMSYYMLLGFVPDDVSLAMDLLWLMVLMIVGDIIMGNSLALYILAHLKGGVVGGGGL